MTGYDLHVHTTASDGGDSPAEVVRQAALVGLAGVAITDHDTTLGIPEAVSVGREVGVDVIAGVEMTSEETAFECHILGYFVSLGGALDGVLADMRRARVERAREMLRRLRVLGFDVSEGEVVQLLGPTAVGRPHLAALLVRKGYAPSVREAMRHHLSKRSPAYVARKKLLPEEVVDAIVSDGGVAVFAHPGLVGMDGLIERLLPRGLAGVEAYHPEHTTEDTARYVALAKRLGLVVTGGSDYHGKLSSRSAPLGSLTTPADAVAELRARLGAGRGGAARPTANT
jgi:hypothetical protein